MSSNKKKIMGSAVLLFGLALLNKGFGFIKSLALATIFGATQMTDAFNVADGLMLNALVPLAEAMAVSFLPVYIGIREKGKKEAQAFTSRTLIDVFLVGIGMSAVLYVLAPLILALMLPTYSQGELKLTIFYFRILIWGMCFYMSNQLLQSLLNAEKQYGYSSFTAMINNLILTATAVILGARFGMTAMAAAVPFSYMIQYVFLFGKTRGYGSVTLRYGLYDSQVIRMCMQALPIFFGTAICELNTLVDRSLLSRMAVGSVTAVSYAAVLYQFASNLIGIPLNTIIYTELAESFAAGRMEEGAEKLEKGIHISFFFCIPLSVFVVMMAKVIVQITYGHGAFDAAAVAMTAQGLQFYGLCFLAYCINAVVFRACYSLNDTVLPMKVGMGTVSLNIVLSILLSKVMGLRGVVLATAIANSLTSIITLIIFHRTKIRLHFERLIGPAVKMIAAAFAGSVSCWLWKEYPPVQNGIVIFIVGAVLEFGIYGMLMLFWKDEMVLEIIKVLKSLAGRKRKNET